MSRKLSITVETPTRKRTGVVPRSAFKAGEENPHAFKKGQSGNPAGRAKNADRRLVSKALRCQLSMRAPNEVAKALGLPFGCSWAQAVARMLLHQAVRGDVSAAREIRESVEGSHTHNSLQLLDEFGDPQKVPNLKIVFNSDLAPGLDPTTFRPEPHYLDRTTPALPLPPLPCKIG